MAWFCPCPFGMTMLPTWHGLMHPSLLVKIQMRGALKKPDRFVRSKSSSLSDRVVQSDSVGLFRIRISGHHVAQVKEIRLNNHLNHLETQNVEAWSASRSLQCDRERSDHCEGTKPTGICEVLQHQIWRDWIHIFRGPTSQ